MSNKLIRIWCWINGHNIICLKRYTILLEYGNPLVTTSAHQCVRCNKRWIEQWDG